MGGRKIFCQNFQNKLDIRSPQEVLITKNTKVEKILSTEKLKSQGGTLGPLEVEKFFFVKILQTNYIFGVHIWSSSEKNKKLEKISTIEKLTPQGGTRGASEVETFFVEILKTNYIFGVHMGSSSQKTKN